MLDLGLDSGDAPEYPVDPPRRTHHVLPLVVLPARVLPFLRSAVVVLRLALHGISAVADSDVGNSHALVRV